MVKIICISKLDKQNENLGKTFYANRAYFIESFQNEEVEINIFIYPKTRPFRKRIWRRRRSAYQIILPHSASSQKRMMV